MKIKSIRNKIIIRIIILGFITFFLMILTSYLTIVPSLQEKAITKAQNISLEIGRQADRLLSNIENYTETIALSLQMNSQIMNYLSQPSKQNYSIVCQTLNNLVSSQGLVRCILIQNNNTVFDSFSKVTDKDYEIISSDWYQSLGQSSYASGFSKTYQININGINYYSAAYSKHFYFSNQRVTFTVIFDLDTLLYDTQILSKNSLDYYLWLDSAQNAFCSSGSEDWTNAVIEKISKNLDNLENVNIKFNGISIENISAISQWRFISFVSQKTVFSDYENFAVNIILILLLFLIITILLMTPTISNIVKPISMLASVMTKVSSNNLACQVDITTNDEIGELSAVFNKMIQDLKSNLQIIIEKEKLEQKIKYCLLVSQIDPHFIYNTMNSINYLARKGRCDDIIAVNSALVQILRDRLRLNDIQIMDSIKNEISIIEYYITIQKYLYDGTLELVWQVDEALLEEEIPKNVIQTLVENAIFHGLIDEELGEINGKIEIKIEKSHEEITIMVKDNGRGMDQEKLMNLREQSPSSQPYERGKHIGLSNLKARLLYLFGNADCMQIESEPNKGASFIIHIKN